MQNSPIENNLLYNNHASGISLYQIDAAAGSTNNVVVNNTIIMAADCALGAEHPGRQHGQHGLQQRPAEQQRLGRRIDIAPDSLPGFASDLTP